ncbi:unnamed protein product, partial [Brassica rapa subsp. narinosa]
MRSKGKRRHFFLKIRSKRGRKGSWVLRGKQTKNKEKKMLEKEKGRSFGQKSSFCSVFCNKFFLLSENNFSYFLFLSPSTL